MSGLRLHDATAADPLKFQRLSFTHNHNTLSDLANRTAANSTMSSTSNSNNKMTATGSASSSPPSATPFPWKLHEMLERSEPESFDHIVSWVPSGNGFKVHNPQAFVKEILPRYFRQTKYKSFQRQCNIWGFERWLHGPHKGGYFHPDLVRGEAQLCAKMKRQKIKGAAGATTIASTAPASPPMKRSVSTVSHSSGGSAGSMESSASHSLRSISPSSPTIVGRPYTVTQIPTTTTLSSSGVSAFHEIPIISPTPEKESMDQVVNEILSSGPPPQTGDCVGFEGQHFFFIGDDECASSNKAEDQAQSAAVPKRHERRLSFNLFAACREESDAALVEMLVAEASPTAEFSLTSSSYFY